MKYSFKAYLGEKYSFMREMVFATLRESDIWKRLPRVSELDGAERDRVARKKHRIITRYIADSILRHGFVQIMQIDVVVTTFCSLNCKNCGEWIPYLKEKKTFSLENIVRSIDNLFRNVGFIHRINIIGGRLCCIQSFLKS